jgi:alanyl-tRNA synthetase
LCGGTHVSSTGQIGLLKIAKEEGIGSGVRRIVASCGEPSLAAFQTVAATMRTLCETMGVDADSLVSRVESLMESNKELERKNQKLVMAGMVESARENVNRAIRIDGMALVAEKFQGVSRDILRRIGDRIKQIEPDSVVLLAGIDDDGVSLIGMASDEAASRGVHAGNLVKEISARMGGSGGGKPTMGQGGGKDSSRLDELLASAGDIVRAQLKK